METGKLQDRLDDVGWDLSHQVQAIANRLGTLLWTPPFARSGDSGGGLPWVAPCSRRRTCCCWTSRQTT